MGRIISTHSFRGGTGKSNTTANLAVLLARCNKRVGIIDTDIQSPGIHVIFRVEEKDIAHSLNDFLWGRCRIEEAAIDLSTRALGAMEPGGERPRLFLIASSIKSGEIAAVLREGYDVARLNDGIYELIDRLRLDHLLIDTHPGVNEETLLSIALSDTLILILRPDQQDFQGTAVTAELARRLEVPQTLIVINKVLPVMDPVALRSQVEAAYGAEVATILPFNDAMVQLASGDLFANRYPDHPFTRELSRLASRLASQAGT